MILRKVIMHNFGVYASTNQFEFKGNKPVVLIGGMNGRKNYFFGSGSFRIVWFKFICIYRK